MTQPKTDLAYLRSEKAKAEQQLRYYKHREKILEHQIPELTRKARVHRLCTRAGMLESFLIAPEDLTNDQVMELLKIAYDFAYCPHNSHIKSPLRADTDSPGWLRATSSGAI